MNIVFLLLAFLGPQANMTAPKPHVAGHYYLVGEHEVGSELLLKPNGQFEYMMSYGAMDYSASGTWTVAGDSVILESKPQSSVAFQVVKSDDLPSSDVRVHVRAKNGHPMEGVTVILNDKEAFTATTDKDGLAVFSNFRSVEQKPKSAVVRLEDVEIESNAIQLDPAHSDFTIEVNPDALTAVSFHHEALKIKGATLVMLYWDKSHPLNYSKQ